MVVCCCLFGGLVFGFGYYVGLLITCLFVYLLFDWVCVLGLLIWWWRVLVVVVLACLVAVVCLFCCVCLFVVLLLDSCYLLFGICYLLLLFGRSCFAFVILGCFVCVSCCMVVCVTWLCVCVMLFWFWRLLLCSSFNSVVFY